MREVYPGAPTHAMGRRHNISLLIKPEESHRLIRGFLEHLDRVEACLNLH
jgi:hypothetical protein